MTTLNSAWPTRSTLPFPQATLDIELRLNIYGATPIDWLTAHGRLIVTSVTNDLSVSISQLFLTQVGDA